MKSIFLCFLAIMSASSFSTSSVKDEDPSFEIGTAASVLLYPNSKYYLSYSGDGILSCVGSLLPSGVTVSGNKIYFGNTLPQGSNEIQIVCQNQFGQTKLGYGSLTLINPPDAQKRVQGRAMLQEPNFKNLRHKQTDFKATIILSWGFTILGWNSI